MRRDQTILQIQPKDDFFPIAAKPFLEYVRFGKGHASADDIFSPGIQNSVQRLLRLHSAAKLNFQTDRLGFGACRISLAIPKAEDYPGLDYFNGKRIATSYPNILRGFLEKNGVSARINVIAGSVEIAPTVGMSDAIFDIVSSGGTLVSNGLKEVEKVVFSEAVLISGGNLSDEKTKLLEQIKFRFNAVRDSRGKKYLLMNIPDDRIEDAIQIVPAMRSPTVLPLAQSGWSSLHSVVDESVLWEKIESLKEIGAEGILVLSVEKMVL